MNLTRLLPRLLLSRPRFAVSARSAVWLTFAFSSLFLAFYVVRFVSRTPIHDEYSNALYHFHHLPLSGYWDQHNEHRIPLPRILYIQAVRLAGNDFRAPPILNVFLLTAAVAFFLHAMKRLRGSHSLADAALPLGLLTVGQYGNLLWGFQVQFIASTGLSLVALGIAAAPGIGSSPRRLAGLGICGMLLPLCGMNGVAFAPGIAAGLLFAGVSGLIARQRLAALVALFFGVAVIALLLAYFHGYQEPPHHANVHGSVTDAVVGTVNLLGAAFGPVVRWLPEQPYDGVTAFGLLGTLLVAATGLMLARAALAPEHRTHAVVLGGVLVGFLGLAAGIAKGRAGLSNVLEPNRYVSLMLPMVAGAYAAWAAFGFTRIATALAAVVVLCAVPNAVIGWREAKPTVFVAKQVELDVAAGLPLDFIADRNWRLYPGEAKYRRGFLELLRANGVAPFAGAAPMPKFREEEIPLRIVKLVNATAEGDTVTVTGDTGCVVFGLPEKRYVYALKLTYSTEEGERHGYPNVMSWSPRGGIPERHEHVVINQLEGNADRAETLIWIRNEIDVLRVDSFGNGAKFRIHKLVLLALPTVE